MDQPSGSGEPGHENNTGTRGGGKLEVPVLPLLSAVVFPDTIANVQVSRASNLALVEAAEEGALIGLLLQKKPAEHHPKAVDLYRVGVTARLLNKLRLSKDSYQIFVQGIDRIMVDTFVQWQPIIRASVIPLRADRPAADTLRPLSERILSSLQHFITNAPRIPSEVFNIIKMNSDEGGKLADLIATNIPFELRERQQVLEALDVEHRLNVILDLIDRELSNMRVFNEVADLAKEEINKQQRQQFLRRQLKTIQRELGEDPEQMRLEQLRKRVAGTAMPTDALIRAERELARLEGMLPSSAEYNVILSYLDWLIEIPWESSTEDSTDLGHARDVLDRYHFGLDEVKERILEFLAVRYLRRDVRGPILCFSGPPGVGKTSLGRAIAESLGRSFARISVGGVKDESEILGHRRTYVGAMPGRIVQSLRQAGSINPVFMIDEIDKMGSDFRGDPSSALLEVLDPEQNTEFYDHYLDLPLNLSRVFFIATSNVLANIPPALRDRMEVIDLPGYIESEKVEIARRHLLPRQLEAAGLTTDDLQFSEAALQRIVRGYTHEAGVRNLERQLANVCRKIAKRIVAGEAGPFNVSVRQLRPLLGSEKFEREVAAVDDAVGVATALAWSQAGGEILFVEAIKVPGQGRLRLTGQLGDVMRESAEAAFSFVKRTAAERGVSAAVFKDHDIHVHLPVGAIAKDGPSAGLALVAAALSLVTGRPVRHDVAMTGEITLTGRVLPIGGLKEKAIAAHRGGIDTVIIPGRNRDEIEQMPPEVRRGLKFIPVDRIGDAMELALHEEGK